MGLPSLAIVMGHVSRASNHPLEDYVRILFILLLCFVSKLAYAQKQPRAVANEGRYEIRELLTNYEIEFVASTLLADDLSKLEQVQLDVDRLIEFSRNSPRALFYLFEFAVFHSKAAGSARQFLGQPLPGSHPDFKKAIQGGIQFLFDIILDPDISENAQTEKYSALFILNLLANVDSLIRERLPATAGLLALSEKALDRKNALQLLKLFIRFDLASLVSIRDAFRILATDFVSDDQIESILRGRKTLAREEVSELYMQMRDTAKARYALDILVKLGSRAEGLLDAFQELIRSRRESKVDLRIHLEALSKLGDLAIPALPDVFDLIFNDTPLSYDERYGIHNLVKSISKTSRAALPFVERAFIYLDHGSETQRFMAPLLVSSLGVHAPSTMIKQIGDLHLRNLKNGLPSELGFPLKELSESHASATNYFLRVAALDPKNNLDSFRYARLTPDQNSFDYLKGYLIGAQDDPENLRAHNIYYLLADLASKHQVIAEQMLDLWKTQPEVRALAASSPPQISVFPQNSRYFNWLENPHLVCEVICNLAETSVARLPRSAAESWAAWWEGAETSLNAFLEPLEDLFVSKAERVCTNENIKRRSIEVFSRFTNSDAFRKSEQEIDNLKYKQFRILRTQVLLHTLSGFFESSGEWKKMRSVHGPALAIVTDFLLQNLGTQLSDALSVDAGLGTGMLGSEIIKTLTLLSAIGFEPFWNSPVAADLFRESSPSHDSPLLNLSNYLVEPSQERAVNLFTTISKELQRGKEHLAEITRFESLNSLFIPPEEDIPFQYFATIPFVATAVRVLQHRLDLSKYYQDQMNDHLMKLKVGLYQFIQADLRTMVPVGALTDRPIVTSSRFNTPMGGLALLALHGDECARVTRRKDRNVLHLGILSSKVLSVGSKARNANLLK